MKLCDSYLFLKKFLDCIDRITYSVDGIMLIYCNVLYFSIVVFVFLIVGLSFCLSI